MSVALQRVSSEFRLTWFDRLLLNIAPSWGQRRIEARARAQAFARHYEAAQGSRRTTGWYRTASDANVANSPALVALREHSRDLRRNNGWAKRGVQVIVNNTVGWGIMPKPKARPTHATARAQQAIRKWNDWADSTSCDYDGRLNFYGIQRLAMETIAESGEVLFLKQPAESADGLPIPMRLQVLEPDYLDHTRNGIVGPGGGPIIDGVEFDKKGRRVAYWIYTHHPGGIRILTSQFASVRVEAERVIHAYRVDRPGQVRGVPWLSSAITRIKDLDDFEDAELMRQKVAACFGAFVTDMDGTSTPALGTGGADRDGNPIENLEPGTVSYLKPGQDVRFPTLPTVSDASFSARSLRRIAVSLGVPYEELTGDYGSVNFSSARMSRLAHWANVTEWREHMIIPQICDGVWRWAMELAGALNDWPTVPYADWAAPPMPILEPDKEGLAFQRMIRTGMRTLPQAIREQGFDPMEQIDEIERFNAELDKRGIVLDCDPRKLTSAGQAQALPAGGDAEDAADGNDSEDGTADDGDGNDAEDAADEATDAKTAH